MDNKKWINWTRAKWQKIAETDAQIKSAKTREELSGIKTEMIWNRIFEAVHLVAKYINREQKIELANIEQAESRNMDAVIKKEIETCKR